MDRVKHVCFVLCALYLCGLQSKQSRQKSSKKLSKPPTRTSKANADVRSVRELVVNDSHILPVLHVNEQKDDHFENER